MAAIEKSNNMKTYMAKEADQKSREWLLVDAKDQVLGRLSTKLARVLMGKHKPTYTPHIDMGDFVILVNTDMIRVTGRKAEQKVYPYYTGWRGGLKARTFVDMMEKDSGWVIKQAVRRMLPKTKLGKTMLSKLKTFPGSDHTHTSQTPKPTDLQRA